MAESKTPSHKGLCCKELSHEEPVHQTLGSKKEIRSQIRALRAELVKPEHAAEKAAMDEKIREAVLQLLHTLKAEESILQTVYCYASFGGEVDTFGLMDALWQQGFSLALPRVTRNRMDFYLVEGRNDLVPGFRNNRQNIARQRIVQSPW